jgi:AraC family ethanolamine operon transcriptional activator
MGEAVSNADTVDPDVVHVHDVDLLNHAVSGSNLELIQLKPGRIDAAVDHQSLGDLFVDRGTVNLPLRVQGGLDPLKFGIGLFHPGAHATWNGNEVDASGLLFFMPGRELSGYFSGAYGWTSLVIPPAWVETISLATYRSGALQLREDCRLIHPEPLKLAELFHAIAALNLPAPEFYDSADRSTWLITDVRNALGGALSAVDQSRANLAYSAKAHFRVAQRAERYMRQRITEPLHIDEVCVALNVSRRYLEYAFIDAFGTSPSRYLRLLRLHEVRRRLKALGDSTTVTHEAISLGFNHLSLFSVQYKKTFGESPSATLAAVVR